MKKYYVLNVRLESGVEYTVRVRGADLEEVEKCIRSMAGYAEHTIVSSVSPMRPHTKHESAISRARLEKGWTQQDLADAIGVAQQHVQRWESGKHKPQTAVLVKIGEALGVDWSTLVE